MISFKNYEVSRSLYLNETVTNESCQKLVEQINLINQYDDEQEKKLNDYKREPIKLYVNTYGGSVYAGLWLIDVMMSSKTEVYTYGSVCMSMGLFIFAAGHKRYSYKNATFMFHDVSFRVSGEVEYIRNEIQESERLRDRCIIDLINRTELPNADLQKSIKESKNFYFDSEYALKYKLANAIV